MAKAFQSIERDPQLHRARYLSDGREYRCYIVKPFLVCYGVLNGHDRVFAILDGRQDIEKILRSRIAGPSAN
jgi:hypothetical protein